MNNHKESLLTWSIRAAKFHFDSAEDYQDWKRDKRVFFLFRPSQSDDRGETVFADPENSFDDFEISAGDGDLLIYLEDSGPVITARVTIKVALRPGVDDEAIASWALEKGGWFGSTISLGLYDVSLTEDQGGDWELIG
ncbi:hypothetical protein EH32_11080 [Erythrobacter litoralis]|uniref:Uncharacterized protein n=2 Tax=Erythrobacter litoralis TaxID=39960 RepID=A0A074MKD9_9SPHN|nr:hypothetical protein EH32_11080 [Erythrobacter litoralis]